LPSRFAAAWIHANQEAIERAQNPL